NDGAARRDGINTEVPALPDRQVGLIPIDPSLPVGRFMTPVRWPHSIQGHHAAVAVVAIMALGLAAPEPDGIVESDETFKSRGKEYTVDVFAPNAPGKHPAIVVVHGHGGVGEGKRSGSHGLARHLARAGYVAMVPHYFGGLKPDSKDGRKNARSFAVWARTVSDAVGSAARRPDVDPQRIGLLGSSLGSWVSLSVAARDRRGAPARAGRRRGRPGGG